MKSIEEIIQNVCNTCDLSEGQIYSLEQALADLEIKFEKEISSLKGKQFYYYRELFCRNAARRFLEAGEVYARNLDSLKMRVSFGLARFWALKFAPKQFHSKDRTKRLSSHHWYVRYWKYDIQDWAKQIESNYELLINKENVVIESIICKANCRDEEIVQSLREVSDDLQDKLKAKKQSSKDRYQFYLVGGRFCRNAARQFLNLAKGYARKGNKTGVDSSIRLARFWAKEFAPKGFRLGNLCSEDWFVKYWSFEIQARGRQIWEIYNYYVNSQNAESQGAESTLEVVEVGVVEAEVLQESQVSQEEVQELVQQSLLAAAS